MRVLAIAALCAAAVLGTFFDKYAGAQAVDRIASAGVRQPVAQPKFTFILFWKEDNPATQQLAEALQTSVNARADRAEMTSINITDPARRPTVERFQVDRAPMPMILCVAPNGAITGVITRQFNDQAVERAIVSPVTADIAKAIQSKKLVLVHIKRDPNAPLPAGAAAFIADPDFQPRTVALDLRVDDPQEASFLADMKIDPAKVDGSLITLLAPPGALVGTFAADATSDQLAAALHAAGKCCDDPNCKHNQKAN